jgi:hypothetical protein
MYRVSSAHRVEVEVIADGPASAPPSGAVAVAPPAGTHSIHNIISTYCNIINCGNKSNNNNYFYNMQ